MNKSGRSIDAFYISPCWAKNWGNNQISWTPVWTSKTFTIKDIEPGCYNLMIVLPFGNKCVISGELIEGVKSLDDHAAGQLVRACHGRLLLYRRTR